MTAIKYETLLYEKRDHIVLVTLNRPERLNALNRMVFEELLGVVGRIEQDDDVHVWLLTGSPRPGGGPMFSSGLDLKSRAETGPLPKWLPSGLMNRIDDLHKPSVAVIDGLCTTGGLELALAFDLRVCSDRAQFSDWHLKAVGNGVGMWGGGARLSRLIGLSRAKHLILTGKVIDAQEALNIGLVNEVFPADKLMESAWGMASQIAAMKPEGVKTTLAYLESGIDMQKHQALYWATQIGPLTGNYPDADRAAAKFTGGGAEGKGKG